MDTKFMMSVLNKYKGTDEQKIAILDDYIAKYTFLSKIGTLKKEYRDEFEVLKNLRSSIAKKISK